MIRDMDQELREMRSSPAEKRPVMFIAYIDQGEGCDYMISCGKKLLKLEAIDWDEAIEEVKEWAVGEEGYFGEYKLEEIELFEIANSQQMPLSKWYHEVEEKKRATKVKDKEYADKVEYERLKLRFG